ncbi:MAG: dihydroorotase [Clostridia bacterium]|nr:MAG: dihydroorotase [Clostridia bacterium]
MDQEPADVLVLEGKIARVGCDLPAPAGARVVDASGRIVAPGLVDMHVHLREPGYEHKETIATGTRAAAMGGITSLVCMPNTDPPADNPGTLAWIAARARETGAARVWPAGCITKGRRGEELAEMASLAAAGAVAFSDDGFPVARAGVMRRALEYAGSLGRVVISHCEDPDLAGGGVMHEGYWSTVLGLVGMPAAAEEVMVAREIILARLTGQRVHLAHLSTGLSAAMVRRAREEGLPVTAEVTPHHLALSDAAVAGYDTSTKVNPPLRPQEDVEALRQALAGGVVQVIASDHAPHAAQEKEQDFDQVPFGISGVETMLPVVATVLVKSGLLAWSRALAAMTVKPARILGLPVGTLEPGALADITLIDPELEMVVDRDRFVSLGHNSPFHGWKLSGWPVMTIVGGEIVMDGRQLLS